jgi:threonine dehydratase
LPCMRCVAAPPGSGPPLPDRAALDAVRHLSRRFPDARVREVPLVRAAELDPRADPTGATRVWLALEALQVTGSFQVRGALLAVASAARSDSRSRHVVAPSVGNHGIGIAYAACVLGVSATVVVPRTASRTKREKIERYGAELVVAATDRYDVADALAKEIAATLGAACVAAEDVEVMLGNGSSLGFEIVRALGGLPERVIAPFGGGGLTTGLAWALAADAVGPTERSVWGVQSEVCSRMAAALESGSVADVTYAHGPTLAEELAGVLSADSFERARTAIAGIALVTETQIASAMLHAYEDMGLVLEGTAAVALAPVLFGLPDRLRGGDVVVVLTGRNIDPDRLDDVLARSERAV